MSGDALLLDSIRTEFKRKMGITLNAIVRGSGRALRMAAEGKVDLTITHDPVAEREFVARSDLPNNQSISAPSQMGRQ
jgi:ABC-type tungstate transport system permease subunit